MTNKLLATYMNDHFAASSAGEQLFKRAADRQRQSPIGGQLADLATAIQQDRARLRAIMSRLDVTENQPKVLAAKAAELIGRLKPNRFVVRRSPLSDLVEVEAMRVGVASKTAGWQAMLEAIPADQVEVREELADLLHRAEEQAEQLADLHRRVAAARLTR